MHTSVNCICILQNHARPYYTTVVGSESDSIFWCSDCESSCFAEHIRCSSQGFLRGGIGRANDACLLPASCIVMLNVVGQNVT